MTTFEQAIEILEPFKKTAYIPETVAVTAAFSTASKFGGLPYLRNTEDWPICPNCKKHQQLFLQLNLAELPDNQGDGIIQLFYCTSMKPHCEADLEAFFPFTAAVTCRKIAIEGESATIEPIIDDVFDEKQIKGWDAKIDYPHFEEYELLGIDLEIDGLIEMMEEKEQGLPIAGDKLGGYPYWIQSMEYPNDRTTGTQMKLLFQLDSNDNLQYIFGDMGIGHLTQSPDNAEELGFGWACY